MTGIGPIWRDHWPEYLMEAAELGTFMLFACLFTVLLFHPDSPVPRVILDPTVRRVLMGLAMGSTAIALIYSPWGRRSGAHFNPAVTLTFLRLGKVDPRDAAGYVAAQFVGGAAGVLLAAALLGSRVMHMSVNFAVTVPGAYGTGAALVAEVAISFILMLVVLSVSNHPPRAHLTGLCAGALVALYISVEAPISGMSMNPARTVASALGAHLWTGLWIYFVAPPVGMLLAAELYLRARGAAEIFCAKLHHAAGTRCIFCEYRSGRAEQMQLRDARQHQRDLPSIPTVS